MSCAQTAVTVCSEWWYNVTVLLQTGGVCCCFVMLVLLGRDAEAQTNCAKQHTGSGAFICYPNPAENGADSSVPDIFHLSAQGNAPNGHAIARYTVLMDKRVIYENRLAIPTQRLSIETNLKSPFVSGSHTLQLVLQGVGSAEVNGLQVYPSKNASFCDPFSRFDKRACNMSNIRGPLRWSLPESGPRTSTLENARQPSESLNGFFAYMELYGQNLKSIEADVSDAIAVDAQGNVYVASHAFTDVELRKYAPTGSIVYDSLVHSCGDGFLSVTGLAISNAGRVWIAGNTNACFPTTPGAFLSHVSEASRTRGFVMLIDTAKPSSAIAPLYVTYLSDVDNRIASIRVDSEGKAYVTGTTASLEFPHESSLSVPGSSVPLRSTRLGFVSVLNPSGSGLQWSTLLPNAQLTALVLGRLGNVYVTGRVASGQSSANSRKSVRPARPAKQSCGAQGNLANGCDDILVAELSDRGRRLSYVARFGGSGDEEGRAISTDAQGGWVFVAGDTDSPDFPTSLVTNTSRREGLQSFAVALQPCKTGILYSRLIPEAYNRVAPGIALEPALDAFTTTFPGAFAVAELGKTGQKPVASVQIAPTCPSDTQ